MARRSHQNRRSQILAGALAVFAARGYEGASLREIAEHIDINKGHVSYYFSAKEDLLFEIIDNVHEVYLGLIDPATDKDVAPWDALGNLLREHVLLVCQNLEAARVSYEDFRFLSSDRQQIVVAKRDAYELHLRRLVAKCLDRSVRAHSTTLAVRGVLGIVNWPYHWFHPGGAISAAELADAASRMALGAVAAMADPELTSGTD